MGKITRWLVGKGTHSFGGLPGHSHPVDEAGTIDCADCGAAHGLPPVEVAEPTAPKTKAPAKAETETEKP